MVEHAVGVGLGNGLGDLGHVGVALADVHVVADADDVGHERDHRGGLADGLAVRDLALALVEVLELEPSRFVALENEKRVRVELSRKSETARPELKMRGEMLRSRRSRSAAATA